VSAVAGRSAVVQPTATDRSLTDALVLRFGVPVATMLVITAVAVLALMTPFYMHPALDAAGSARYLGVSQPEARELSDATIADLFSPAGSFALFRSDEQAHMRDVRVVLWGFLALSVVAAVALAVAVARRRDRTAVVRAVGNGGAALAVGAVVVGAVAAVAFEAVFELFHHIFFPGGNWSFDPTTSRLVQLYPETFWELTSAALGVLLVGGGAILWLLTRRLARR
jgi:integral membrane protein (TIGR01906 family)